MAVKQRSGRHIIVCVADTHVNSTVGLATPTVSRDDGGDYHATTAQQWLWASHCDFLDKARTILKRGDRVYGIINGDSVDCNSHSPYQLISPNEADVLRAAVAVHRPLRELAVDGLFVLRGTEAHSGGAGWIEELLAHELSAEHWPATAHTSSAWHIRLDIGGVAIDCCHHSPSGRLPWTRLNAAGRIATELAMSYAKYGQPPPALALRAHNHRFLDSGETYPVRVIGQRAWMLADSYAHKVAPDSVADIGGAIIVIEGGRADVRHVSYRPEREASWQPA